MIGLVSLSASVFCRLSGAARNLLSRAAELLRTFPDFFERGAHARYGLIERLRHGSDFVFRVDVQLLAEVSVGDRFQQSQGAIHWPKNAVCDYEAQDRDCGQNRCAEDDQIVLLDRTVDEASFS